jgi:hypothetical protein
MEDHLADFEALRKMLITPEHRKLASSALRRSKENSFLCSSVSLKVQIEKKTSIMKKLIKRPAKVLLVGQLLDQSKSKRLCGPPPLLFRMGKTAGLYLIPIKSYSKNGG